MPSGWTTDNALGVPYHTGPEGASTSTEVPARFPVALNGVPFMVDTERADDWYQRPVPRLREQFDASDEAGEQSLSAEDFWRRSPDGWHGGAGQNLLDDPESSRVRFRSSKGINVWTKDRFELLFAVDQKRSSANTNLRLAPAGSRLYLIDGNSLLHTSDITVDTPTWTAVTAGGPALSSPTQLASDGFTVWVIDGTDLYYTTRTTGTYQPWHSSATGGHELVGYAKSRLITSGDGSNKHRLYVHGAQGTAPPAAHYSHPNTDWTWTAVAEIPQAILVAGFSGDRSAIYRMAVDDTGATLQQPIQAGELPEGETVRAMVGYLGFVVLGTDRGLRFAATDDAGNLQIGDLIALSAPVECFEPQDRFVWFGWKDYDATSTGLGRIDLRTLNDTAPAYASDLLASGQGNVGSVVTFQDRRVFTVAAVGVFGEDTVRVASGTIDSGEIGYGLTAEKQAVAVDIHHLAGAGTIAAAVAVDGGPFVDAGGTITTGATAGAVSLPVQNDTGGSTFEVRITLTRGVDATQSPAVNRWTLRADPKLATRTLFSVPLLLHAHVELPNGGRWSADPAALLEDLIGLHESQRVFAYQRDRQSSPVRLIEYVWQPHKFTPDGRTEGTFVALMKDI